jgi:hypothetical protein
MKRLFVIAFCSTALMGCGGSSTDDGITQGADTGSFNGVYDGTLELQATVDMVGASSKSANESATVEIEITENGAVHLSIDEIRVEGIVDDNGDWELEIAINDFGFLIDDEGKDTLKTAGCRLGRKFAKIEGQVTPPTMSGEVSGKLSCKVLLVEAGTLKVSGTLIAIK